MADRRALTAASVSRRAYQAAVDGQTSTFFYVRRFVSNTGGPDEYVFVTCRLTGGGARTPLALLDVQLAYHLFRAIPTGMKLILTGDVDQRFLGVVPQ